MEQDNEQMTDREKELIEKLAKAEQDKANLVSEITETRKSRQEEAAEKEALKKELEKSTAGDQGKDTEEVVRSILSREKQEVVKKNLETAKEEFKKNFKEFSPDTDAGGILFSKFERELAKFNLSGLETKEEFAARMNDAYRLISNGKQPTKVNFYTGHDEATGTDPKEVNADNLSSAELNLMKDIGWTKERYLKQKAKNPVYVENLLKYRR